MADGTTRPIEQLKVGDRVWSRNEKTGRTRAQTVTNTIRHRSQVVVHLTLQDSSSGRAEEIVVSTEHPFYVDGKGWVGAEQLGIGAQIVTRAGPKLTVEAVRTESSVAGYTLYNLTVDSDHTYFVGKVDGGAWVHNADCPPTLGEARELVSGWAEDPKTGRIKDSIRYHFDEHGDETGADTVWRYLRQAKGFRQQLRGVRRFRVPGKTSGVIRYVKSGKYIDLNADGKIISFGLR